MMIRVTWWQSKVGVTFNLKITQIHLKVFRSLSSERLGGPITHSLESRVCVIKLRELKKDDAKQTLATNDASSLGEGGRTGATSTRGPTRTLSSEPSTNLPAVPCALRLSAAFCLLEASKLLFLSGTPLGLRRRESTLTYKIKATLNIGEAPGNKWLGIP